MMRRVVAVTLSLAIVLMSVPRTSAAGSALGQVSGIATETGGAQFAGQTARLRSLDMGQVTDLTTTSTSGRFAFSNVNPGSYVVELIANGRVVGVSAPIGLTPRNMNADGVSAIAEPPAAGQARAGALAGSFWGSRAGIITAAAIVGGVVATIIIVKHNASPSS